MCALILNLSSVSPETDFKTTDGENGNPRIELKGKIDWENK